MTVIATDDMGPYTDTGVTISPTQRPSTVVDYSTLVAPVLPTPVDTGSTGRKLPPASRSQGQRR